MPRPGRSFEEGRTYHVYNRVGGGDLVFEDAGLANAFVELFREVAIRDDLVALGWCLLGNHYHLILRQNRVPLSLSMKSIQQGTTRERNQRKHSYGPLWQGRFKAMEVGDERYLRQLVAYVHLNPVKAGLAAKADDFLWSGHREVIGEVRDPIVTVDDTLLLFGRTRRQALQCYCEVIAGIDEEEWSSGMPGELPWWRLGRPSKDEELKRSEGAFIDELGRSTAAERPVYRASTWVELAAHHLRVDLEDIRGTGRDPQVIRCRELIGLVGIRLLGVSAGELAEVLGKSRDGVWRWQVRGEKRRSKDREFAAEADALERAAREEIKP